MKRHRKPPIHLLTLGAGLILLVGLIACVASPTMLHRAVVHNATSHPISDVLVRHEPTGAIGRVSTLSPRSELDLGFSTQQMKAKRAVITWHEPASGMNRVEVPVPRKDAQGNPGHAFTLVYTIQPDGTVSVRLDP